MILQYPSSRHAADWARGDSTTLITRSENANDESNSGANGSFPIIEVTMNIAYDSPNPSSTWGNVEWPTGYRMAAPAAICILVKKCACNVETAPLGMGLTRQRSTWRSNKECECFQVHVLREGGEVDGKSKADQGVGVLTSEEAANMNQMV
ncbi:hypothetical protein HBI79_127670 [Parastagonospora nodorum]|nr:hypothetical protein HBI79_127670 [Parastagonospora nodorum]